MAEQCPSCNGELFLVDVNAELSLPGQGKSGLYEYRHLPDDGRCSLKAVQPGVTHVRCLCCCKWQSGRRCNGAIICLECIEKGFDYESFDLRKCDYTS